MRTLIEITDYIDSRYYGAYLSATGWKQADNDLASFLYLVQLIILMLICWSIA